MIMYLCPSAPPRISRSLSALVLSLFLPYTALYLLTMAFQSALAPSDRSLNLSRLEASLHTLSLAVGPGCPHLVLLFLKILPLIGNITDELSNGIGSGVVISLPHFSHYPLCLINLNYNQLSSVPGIVPLPLILHQALPKILQLPQQGIDHIVHLHGHIFLLPPDILGVHICSRFAALGPVDDGSDLGPKFGPCLLQFFLHPLREGPLIPLPNPLHLLPSNLYHKPH